MPAGNSHPNGDRRLLGGSTLSSSFMYHGEASDDDKHANRLLRDIASGMIGRNAPFATPFGTKAQVYADYTASGKSLESIERFIHDQVMPTYGNTHTTTSVTGLQTTSFREEARQIIADAVNARASTDVVIFTGQGCTSAINKLVAVLGINKGRRRHRSSKRPVIFTCPFSHHSNLLPWRESLCADEVQIPEAVGGGLDLAELERQLQRHRNRPLKIGSFAAASNVTGILLDVDEVSTLLHKYGALACWDYATCAPYVDINMNPKDSAAFKDAVFFSGHKFVGGPGSPGVLVVKKKLMTNEVPAMPGGGTVLFVTENTQRYLSSTVEREEGGTPDILGSIRLGLAFQLKQCVGPHHIMEIERKHVRYVRESFGRNKNIVILGRQSDSVDQLPIFSLLIRFGNRFLHHNFVCALLNDLFGVQARGGCQCAGPYGARVLGLTHQSMIGFEHALLANINILKPGGTRISFPYFADADEVNYILDSVHFVADHGWKFLPQYEFNIHSGVWRHVSRSKVEFTGKTLLSALDAQDKGPSEMVDTIEDALIHRQDNLEQAARLADLSITMNAASSGLPQSEKIARIYEALRWFVYPGEAVAIFRGLGDNPPLSDKIMGPCQPQHYTEPNTNRERNGSRNVKKSKRHRVKMALLGGSCLSSCSSAK